MISLIIPTYNCIEYLDEAIDSVLSQNCDDLELILVDDGSSDGTAEKLAEFRHHNVKVLLREHGGVSAARNAGIEAATGEWIAFMDCDDCLKEGFIRNGLKVLEEDADLFIFSFERVEFVSKGNGSIEEVTPLLVEDRFYETASDFADHYIRSRHLLIYSACNKFYRKAILDEHGIRFREGIDFGEDRLFNYDYLEFCGSIVTSSEVMFRYMQRNDDSASKRVFADHHDTVMMLHEAKVKCFTGLSRGTSETEKADFIAYDLATEIKRLQEKSQKQYREHGSNVDFHDYIGSRVHMIGIGGASMSGLSIILQQKGCTVSGSDMIDGEILDALRKRGMSIEIGHTCENVKDADLAVYSMAIAEDDPEIVYCMDNGIPIIERSVLLGQLSSDYDRSVAVCGTHGKTTVTSMLAQILMESDVDPTVHIGGVLNSMGGGVRVGNSELFVTEACEYRRNFMNIDPTHIILTNIDEDHLDYYRDIEEIEDAFGDFLAKLPEEGWALVNGDDEHVRNMIGKARCETSTFGRSPSCKYRITNITEDEDGRSSFDVLFEGHPVGHVDMSIPGDFNGMNALAAIAMAHHLGVDAGRACSIVERFTGAHRRFEFTGMLNGAELFHDYGHNPAEMSNAVSIARKRCRRGRLWAVIQPHTYSRVKTMFEDYLSCTKEADVTLITKIFAAREKDPGDIDSGMLVDAMKDRGLDARLTPEFDDVIKVLRSEVREGDLVITMGCGDIYKLNEMLDRRDPASG